LVLLDILDHKELLDPLDQLDHKEELVEMVLLGQLDILDPPDPKGGWDPWDLRVVLVHLEVLAQPVQLDPLVLKVYKESLVQKEFKAFKEKGGKRVQWVKQAQPVYREPKVLPDLLDLLDLWVQLELVQSDPKDYLALPA
jgi:hypothetical protein